MHRFKQMIQRDGRMMDLFFDEASGKLIIRSGLGKPKYYEIWECKSKGYSDYEDFVVFEPTEEQIQKSIAYLERKEQIAKINEEVAAREEAYDEYERNNYPRKSEDSPEGFIEFMNSGLDNIENSPTKHLMFADADYPDDELTIEEEEMIAHSGMGITSETMELRSRGLADYEERVSYPTEEQTEQSARYLESMREFEHEVLQNKSKKTEKPKIFKKIKKGFHL